MGWYILAAIIVLIFQVAISFKFADCAEEKGHSRTAYFWLCFLFGIVGYCLVAALPDGRVHYALNQLIHSNASATVSNNTLNCAQSTASRISTMKATVTESNTWICGKCKTENSMNYGQCKKCGTYRS